MRLFSITIQAIKRNPLPNDLGNMELSSSRSIGTVNYGSSKDDLFLQVMNRCKTLFPASEGYSNHEVFLLEIPPELILSAAEAIASMAAAGEKSVMEPLTDTGREKTVYEVFDDIVNKGKS